MTRLLVEIGLVVVLVASACSSSKPLPYGYYYESTGMKAGLHVIDPEPGVRCYVLPATEQFSRSMSCVRT